MVGTHPLFGPNSGRHGIAGLTVVVCGEGGRKAAAVERFLRNRLALDVRVATPEAHDRQMAYVQGLSHLVARSLRGLVPPELGFGTAGFAKLEGLMELAGGDSDALLATIVGGNPFAPAVLERFLAACRLTYDAAREGE